METKKSYKQYSLEEMLSLPANAVYALASTELNLMFLGESVNLMVGLNKIFEYFRANPKTAEMLPKFELWILDVDVYHMNRKLRVAFLMDEFKAEGWKILNRKKPLRFKAAQIAKKNNLYYVFLNSARRSKYIVGVFDSAVEAKSFYSEHYRNKEIRRVIYHDNDLTRKHLGKKFPG